MSHTPGPWHATDCRHQKNGQVRIFPNERTVCGGNIANVLASNRCCQGNAQLIAEAPELLGILKQLCHDLEEYIPALKNLPPHLTAAGLQGTFICAKQVIAKAEGQ